MRWLWAPAVPLAFAVLGCATPPPGNRTPLDDGLWRIAPFGHASRRLVSLEPRLIKWQIYMDARGDLDGFSRAQVKDALTVRARGMECADWRHIHRSREPSIPGVTIEYSYVDCPPPLGGVVYAPAPVAAQINAAEALGFACQRVGIAQANCTLTISGRAVESTLGMLAHPHPSNMAIEFRAEFDVALGSNDLPTVTCQSWERSTPPDAFIILSDGGPVRVTTAQEPTSRWRGPVQDCAYQGAF